jgi:arylsulfatase A-like enzyme
MSDAAVPLTPGPRAHDAVKMLRMRLQRARTMVEKLRELGEAEQAAPDLARQVHGGLLNVPEKDVMTDDALRLLKVWACHAEGRRAERDYYLHSFALGSDRAQIRTALGVVPGCKAERLVVLLTVDCLRGDRLSCNGCDRPFTPAMDALAAEGVNFPRAYSTAGQTAQSFPGILLSNYFQNFGATRALPDHLTSLPEVLSRHGYRTVGINAANPHVSHFYGYDRGFDEFEDYLGPENFDHIEETFIDNSQRRLQEATNDELMAIFEDCQAHPDIYDLLRETTGREGLGLVQTIAKRARFYPYDAADLVKEAFGRLLDEEGGPRRFFWLHLMDLHENITVPWSPIGAFSPVQQFFLNFLLASPAGMEALRPYAEKYRDLYDSAVAYVDANVQVLRNFLLDAGLWGDSLICVTADHGQELLERGLFGHGYDRLAEGVVRVPLIFSGGLARRLDASAPGRPVSTLDISPTLLDLCGIEEKPDTFLGRTLNDAEPRPVYGQTFYDGADNRCTDKKRRAFELKPFPAPVRECCKEMTFCIRDGYQVVHDAGTGKTQLHRLRSAGVPDGDGPPDADALRRQTREYLDEVYRLPDESEAAGLSESDERILAGRLADLGYL